MKKKSRVISFRLNPHNEIEERALKILEHYKEQGLSLRQIITDAILYRDGATPEMYRKDHVKVTPDTIQDIIANMVPDIVETTVANLLKEFAGYLISQIINDVNNGIVQSNPNQPFDNEDEQLEYEQKMVNAIMSRRQEGKR